MAQAGASGALSHIRVLDLSRILAGPWAAQMLGDLGAEIIKVERPVAGDDTRTWGPPYIKDAAGNDTSDSTYYLCANRNKKSVTIDFTRQEGQQLVRELAAKSDVVIENFKLGGLKKYGLDYESLKPLNPGLIYCSITGFGQTGPYAPRAGYDFLIQGLGGLMSITGRPDDEPGGGPIKVGVALADIMTGMYSATAILAAITHRAQTGIGQYIDMALLDVQVGVLANQAMNYLHAGVLPKRMGNAHPNVVPYQDFQTKDGYVIIAIGNDGQFARLAQVIGKPEWATDPRYSRNAQRVVNRVELISMMNDMTRTRTTEEWVALFEGVGVPCGPINDLEHVFSDPQVNARNMQISMQHPTLGEVPLLANPIRLSESPVQYRSAPPTLGEHTSEVLTELLGMDTQAIARLQHDNVI
ncbi:MAG: CaiB/BaiF CoA-transferase family protein [Burkholderiales bacterium]|jgi:crotonobetainyl-CoA:carnitine CoA-transferase CaiB-like acyl-CoA transferase